MSSRSPSAWGAILAAVLLAILAIIVVGAVGFWARILVEAWAFGYHALP